MGSIDESTSIEELAALVSQALETAGIHGTLSGGGAVSIYSDNQYESVDLDFITSAQNSAIAKALEPLGFSHQPGKREFTHPGTDYYVEFPPGPLAFGNTIVSDKKARSIDTVFGPLRIVTPTESVMDRLTHYVNWNDNQAFDQAVMVASRHPVNWDELTTWAEHEGAPAEVLQRFRAKAEQEE